MTWAKRLRKSRELFHHGDALALVAVAVLAGGPTKLEQLLERLAAHFALVRPEYATRENAERILCVLEHAEAIITEDSVTRLTHRGLQFRLALTNGEPPRGLTEKFVRNGGDFTLSEAA